MKKIGIIDDEKEIALQIKNALKKYDLDIDIFDSGEMFIDAYAKGNEYDLIYLDIEMGLMNGVEVGKLIRNKYHNYKMEIVYITGKTGYERQLFDTQPLNFLEKPLSSQQIIDVYNLALRKNKKEKQWFQYKKGFEYHKVYVENILYFESLDREIKIVTIDSTDLYYGKIKDLDGLYQGFIRIHRSYLINYKYVKRIKINEVEMINGDLLPVSKTKKDEIKKYIMEHELYGL